MNAIATTPGTAALTRPACEAGIGWRTELVDGFPRERIEVCSQVVGLLHYTDVSGTRRTHCTLPNHEASVRRRFPALMYFDAADGTPVEAGDFGRTDVDVDALLADAAHWGQGPRL